MTNSQIERAGTILDKIQYEVKCNHCNCPSNIIFWTDILRKMIYHLDDDIIQDSIIKITCDENEFVL
nr:MAG TPA: hypothetical protein [Microviridae sp.]